MPDSKLQPPPSVSRLQAFAETREFLDDATVVLSRHAKRLGGAFYYYFGGVKKVLVITEPKVFRHILKDNYENYPKSDIQVRRLGQFLGQGLLASHGPPWRRKRRLVQSAFSPEKLVAMGQGMHRSLHGALKVFDQAILKGPVEIGSEVTRMTFSMVAQSLFSTMLPEPDIQLISDGINAIQAFMVRQIVQPHLRPWFVLNGELHRHQEIRARGDAILLRHIRARRADPTPHDDLLHILLNARFEEDGGPLSDGQVLSESMQILVAGHETSSNALGWTLYLLSQHPGHLRDALEELKAVVGLRPLRPNQLLALTVTTNVLEEALRLYPPFWMIDRVALNDDEAGGVPIPAGTTVIVHIHGAQHAVEHWRTADCFVPERFDGEGKALRNDLHHIPFGVGPRRCVGASYAMFQMVMILNAILQNYRFRLADKPPVIPHPMIILGPKAGIWMHFEKVH